MSRGERFEAGRTFTCTVGELWAFHMDAAALDRLAPPLSGFRVVERDRGVAEGSVVVMSVGMGPLRRRWVALHTGVEAEQSFADLALESPFPYWFHLHRFEPCGGGSRLTDVVWFVPPRALQSRLGRALVRGALRVLFAWRHRQTRRAVEAPRTANDASNAAPSTTAGLVSEERI